MFISIVPSGGIGAPDSMRVLRRKLLKPIECDICSDLGMAVVSPGRANVLVKRANSGIGMASMCSESVL